MSATIKADRQIEAPRISAVAPGDSDYVVEVTWENGSVSRVDLTEPIFRLKSLRPLRNKKRFEDVKVADWGWAISWDDDLDFSGERLWEMAKEQAESAMTPSDFRAWLRHNDLTQEAAATLLGISKRSVAYYSTGAQPITRIVALALKGAETELRNTRPKPGRAAKVRA